MDGTPTHAGRTPDETPAGSSGQPLQPPVSAASHADSVAEAAGDGTVGAASSQKGESVLYRHDIDLGGIDVTGHPLGYAFGHGRLHGQWRIEREPYTAYLEMKAQEEALEAEAEWCDQAVRQERELRCQAAELRGRAAGKAVEVRHAAEQVGLAQEQAAEARGAVAHARKALVDLKGRGSRTYTALYGLAGAAFIVGDVALARYTVSVALRMNGWEGWAFAVGLALLAVLLKPVYDRLIEDRYHEGATRAFTLSIVATAALVGVFLLVMGGYRADFMQSNVEHNQLSDRRDDLERQIARAEQFGRAEQQASASRELEEVQSRLAENEGALLNNQKGRWALLLSQLLFAVAGAICLGIATRNWRDWHHLRRPLNDQLGKVRRERDPKRAGELYRQLMAEDAALCEARERHRELQKEQEALEAEVAVLESEGGALERIGHARDRQAEVRMELRDVRAELYGYLYQTGHEIGQKLPEPELRYSGDGHADGKEVELAVASRVGGPKAPTGHRRRRLYLAVREAVRRAAVRPAPPDA